MSESKHEPKLLWVKTSVANMVRCRSSGVYFARVRVAGKLIRQSLKTNVFSVAKIRLADLTQEQRKAAEVGKLSANGKMSFGDARRIYEERLKNNQRLKPTAKLYRMRTIKDLGRAWPRWLQFSEKPAWLAELGRWLNARIGLDRSCHHRIRSHESLNLLDLRKVLCFTRASLEKRRGWRLVCVPSLLIILASQGRSI